MHRLHLVEIEDLPWCPRWLRTCGTNVIVVFMRAIGGETVVAHRVEQALAQTGERSIVDMGSGSGGSMPAVLDAVRAKGIDCDLTLSDLYPNPAMVEHFERMGVDGLRYHPEPVDATDIGTAPPGLKTMINCFHHMPEPVARRIVKAAVETRQPLFIYEPSNVRIPRWLWWLTLPISLPLTALSCLLFTPLVRPMTWQQIVFTYLIPIIPLLYAWDGQVSGIRIYHPDDMRALLDGLETDDYTWEMGRAEGPAGKAVGMYVFGYPTARPAA